MSIAEAIAYAMELMKTRNYCEIARSRVISTIKLQSQEISKRDVEVLVIGVRGSRKN